MRDWEVQRICSTAENDTTVVMPIIQEQNTVFPIHVAHGSLVHRAWLLWEQLDMATTTARGRWAFVLPDSLIAFGNRRHA